jgi:hypothetical protein
MENLNIDISSPVAILAQAQKAQVQVYRVLKKARCDFYGCYCLFCIGIVDCWRYHCSCSYPVGAPGLLVLYQVLASSFPVEEVTHRQFAERPSSHSSLWLNRQKKRLPLSYHWMTS